MSTPSVGHSLHYGEKQGQEWGDPQGKRQHNQEEGRPETPGSGQTSLSGSVSYSSPPTKSPFPLMLVQEG